MCRKLLLLVEKCLEIQISHTQKSFSILVKPCFQDKNHTGILKTLTITIMQRAYREWYIFLHDNNFHFDSAKR